jgi:hypothetical protein
MLYPMRSPFFLFAKRCRNPLKFCESADVSQDFVGLIFGVFNYGNFGCWDVGIAASSGCPTCPIVPGTWEVVVHG